ncbi:uncharacterized protein SPSC_02752 [Sporisorium scitamineum]|uniref:FHA domain-containing protein n=1 Tax=Sporisorium scitamineum TaxID=49012 RepID=A0A0F7RZN9_9BASI|nr:hypothetical protein [Sporisorium scitamineum]CDU24123.1 uncharacterized protein SPSC_02752 [Sporisorium scitamineum]
MSTLASTRGYELVWVNASPTGPAERTLHDPQHFSAIRIPPGKTKTISRSAMETSTAPVNDLGDTIFFPGAKVVSREHAIFEWQDGLLIIKDLGSTRGTFVARRHAKFSDSDVIVETAPLAGKKKVDGILALQDGDMIEFGRKCHLDDTIYHPVRCYLRLARQSAPTPSISQLARSGAFAVPDDALDSDSDIVSIRGDLLSRGQALAAQKQYFERTEAPEAPAAPAAPATPAAMAETPHEVVDLTSDDESNGTNDCGSTFESEQLEDEHASDSDEASSDVNDGLDADSFDDTDSGEDIEPFDFSTVPWRHEIDEVAREQLELQREALDARSQGKAYMAGYKTAQMPDSPATSVEAEAPILDAAKARSVSPLVSLPEQVESSVEAPAPNDASDADIGLTVTAITAQPKEAEPLPSTPKKRKLEAEDTADSPADATDERAETVSATVPTLSLEASPTPDKTQGSNTFHSACASHSPSPSKKIRFLNDQAQGDDTRGRRAPSRARKMQSIAAKTIQVTSLLSAGFLAGSLFTFKSMMNAAAAANAAGYGK